MRRFFKLAAICLAIVLIFCACAKEQEVSSSAPAPFKTADELISEAEQREQKQADVPVPVLSDVAGTYRCRMENVDEAFWPSVVLSDKGGAVFNANIFAGMGIIEGTYTLNDSTVKLIVERVEFRGFAGEKVTDITFDITSDGTLELAYVNPDTPIGVTNPGDRFVKEA